MLSKRIPHFDLLDMLPCKVNFQFFHNFIHENIEELLEIDHLGAVKREDLYYGAESDSDDTIMMLTPAQCQFITGKLVKHFGDSKSGDRYD